MAEVNTDDTIQVLRFDYKNRI